MRGLEFPLDGGGDLLPRTLDLIRSEDRRFHGAIGDGLQDPQGDRTIDPNSTDADAQPRAHVRVVAAALVAMSIALRLTVEDTHHPAAASAPHQPGQERASTARRLARTVLLHMGVLEQKALVVFVVLPADVAGMIVAQQDVPLFAGLVDPADLAGPSVNDPRSLALSAERVGAGVQRIVQDLHDAVIGWRLPDELADIDVAQDDGHLDVG